MSVIRKFFDDNNWTEQDLNLRDWSIDNQTDIEEEIWYLGTNLNEFGQPRDCNVVRVRIDLEGLDVVMGFFGERWRPCRPYISIDDGDTFSIEL